MLETEQEYKVGRYHIGWELLYHQGDFSLGTGFIRIILLGTNVNVDLILLTLKCIYKEIFHHIPHVSGIILL